MTTYILIAIYVIIALAMAGEVNDDGAAQKEHWAVRLIATIVCAIIWPYIVARWVLHILHKTAKA